MMPPPRGNGLRGAGAALPAPNIGLPPRPFLYTIDQVATLLNLADKDVKHRFLFFEGRSIGRPTRDEMVARNIAKADEAPDWRIAERELIRWFKFKGFRFYDKSVITT